MISKKDCVIAAVAGYVVLIILFAYYQQEPRFESVCSYDSACIRFCCRDQTTCNDTFIRENFNMSKHYTISNYKIMLGEPKCSKTLVGANETWLFLSTGDVVLTDGVWRKPDEYCFEDTKINGEVSFNLFVCDSNAKIRELLNFVFMSIAAFVMAATVLVYAYFKELRTDASGKSEFSFVISLFLVSFSLPFFQMYFLVNLRIIATFTFVAGSLLSFLWMSVLSFDIWRTIATKTSQETPGDSKRFMFYCAYVFSILIVSVTMAYIPFAPALHHLIIISYIILLSFVAIAIADIVFLILSAILLLKLSRSTNLPDHKWFEDQKRRFWLYLQLFLILVVTSIVQMHSWALFDAYEAIIVADALACYSVILIFLSFVLRPETMKSFSDKYDKLLN